MARTLSLVAALALGTCQVPAAAHPVSPSSVPGGPAGGEVWAALARCESGMRNLHGPRYYGYHSWLLSTWRAAGGTGRPDQHSYEAQVAVAKRWLARTSWRQWPACSRKLGLR